MTPDRKMLLGKIFPAVTYTIQKRDIQNYLSVSGEHHRAFFTETGSRATGYERRVTPPSFGPFVAVISLLRSFDWEKDFFFDYKRGTAMFGEQELEYIRPLYVGETLTIQGQVSDVYEKQGQKTFDVICVAFTAADENGSAALKGEQSYLLFD